MKTTILFSILITLQFLTIELLGTIDHTAIRCIAFSIALILFTSVWIYIFLHLHQAPRRRTYRDIEIQSTRPNPFIRD